MAMKCAMFPAADGGN